MSIWSKQKPNITAISQPLGASLHRKYPNTLTVIFHLPFLFLVLVIVSADFYIPLSSGYLDSCKQFRVLNFLLVLV